MIGSNLNAVSIAKVSSNLLFKSGVKRVDWKITVQANVNASVTLLYLSCLQNMDNVKKM